MKVLKVVHTPDPDDAFLFYGIVNGAVKISGFEEVQHIIMDIESINRDIIERGEDYHVAALSAHAFFYVAEKYYLLTVGASMGEGYGPIVVAREDLRSLDGKKVAVPGRYTTARLLLKLALDGIEYREVEMRFDKIVEAVLKEDVDAGVLIHDAQLSYKKYGLVKVLELWDWWREVSGNLPMPLGVNVVSKKLGKDIALNIRDALKLSIRYAWENKSIALKYASRYSRTLKEEELIEKFIEMYVGRRAVDMGDEGIEAHSLLYQLAREKKLVPRVEKIEFI